MLCMRNSIVCDHRQYRLWVVADADAGIISNLRHSVFAFVSNKLLVLFFSFRRLNFWIKKIQKKARRHTYNHIHKTTHAYTRAIEYGAARAPYPLNRDPVEDRNDVIRFLFGVFFFHSFLQEPIYCNSSFVLFARTSFGFDKSDLFLPKKKLEKNDDSKLFFLFSIWKFVIRPFIRDFRMADRMA